MKTRYFKDNKSYFMFIEKNKSRIKCVSCEFTKNHIKFIYQFI